ncbi:MAG: AAA family ATPase [Promethearchaeati archaeon]
MAKSKKKIVAFSGKGGVGKTTTLALFLKYLLEKNSREILVIDSDPDANIGDVIGKEIKFDQTLASKMNQMKEKIRNREIPLEMPKNQIIEGEVFETLIEMDKFDIMEMGRQEGEGCYCFINNVLKNVIDTISENYEITLIDSPAGLEHFSRKTGRDVTDLIIVTDPSKMGIHTMKRIVELTYEVNLKFQNIWVIGNRFPESLKEALKKEVESLSEDNVKLLGFIPDGSAIGEYNFLGKSLLEMPEDDPTYQQAKQIFERIL